MNKLTLLLAILTLASCDLFKKGPNSRDLPQEEWTAPSSITTDDLDPDEIQSGTVQVAFQLNYSQGMAPATVAVRFNQFQSTASKGEDGWYRFSANLGPMDASYRLTVGNRGMGKIAAFSKWQLTEQLKAYDPAQAYREDPDLRNAEPDAIEYYQIDQDELDEGLADVLFTLIYDDPLIIKPRVAIRLNGELHYMDPDEDGDHFEYFPVGTTTGPFKLEIGNVAYTSSSGYRYQNFEAWSREVELEVNGAETDLGDFDFWGFLFDDIDWGDLVSDDAEAEEEEEEETVIPDLDALTYPAPDFYGLLEWTEKTEIAWMLDNYLYQLEADFDGDCTAMADTEEAEFSAYLEYCGEIGYMDYSFIPLSFSLDASFGRYMDELEEEMEPYISESVVYDEIPYKVYNFTYSGREYWVYLGRTETTLDEWAFYNLYFEWE